MSDISYKAYVGKTVILSYTCNEYRHYSLIFAHGHHARVRLYVATEVSKNSRFSTVARVGDLLSDIF